MKKAVVVGVMVATLLMGGCHKKEDKKTKPTGKEMSIGQLAAEVKDKYEQDKSFFKEKVSIKRDESIKLELGFDPLEQGMEKFNEIVDIFPSAKLIHSIKPTFKLFNDGKGIEIMPPKIPEAAIANLDVGKDAEGIDIYKHHLFDKGENKDWGNLSEYYMVIHVDLKTGKKLKKPELRVFKVKQELSGELRVKMKLNQEGMPEFSWNKIVGADYYYVVRNTYDDQYGYSNTAYVEEKVEGTQWVPKSLAAFRTYKVSELDRQTEENKKKYGEGTEPILQEGPRQDFAVIAVSKKGTSAISEYLNTRSLAERISYTQEIGLTTKQEGNTTAKTFDKLPAYQWITMCDGKLVQKLINYDISLAEEATETWGDFEKKEDKTELKGTSVDLIKIPYSIEGTRYHGNAKVEDYTKKTLKKQLKKLEERQNKLRIKAGKTDLEIRTIDDSESIDDSEKIYKPEDKITANSALSEYLAINMLAGKRKIDLKEFPEANSQQFLFDAWLEAVHQNPFILGVEAANITKDGQALVVTYNSSISEMQEKQAELKQTIKQTVNKIIKADMTDLEKEYAINQYLCDIAEYDMDALKSAEKHNFETVDKKFNDSFTPYGVLINKLGVCASYAGAFKLLADEANLETIVVTGFLDGDVPHAWNKVKINDEWTIVDSTNNDNELLTNALLNLPEKSSKKILVEDDQYVLDKHLKDYQATNIDTDKEYYHVSNKFFEKNQVINEITSSLEKNTSITLRTKYNLTDEEFDKISERISEKTKNRDIKGIYWMGVLYFLKE